MRKPLPNQGESQKIVDSTTRRVGFSVQNPGSVDVYYIFDDQRTLDTLGTGGIPSAGHFLPGGTQNAPVVHQCVYNARVFARGVAAGAAIEINIWDVDIPCGNGK